MHSDNLDEPLDDWIYEFDGGEAFYNMENDIDLDEEDIAFGRYKVKGDRVRVKIPIEKCVSWRTREGDVLAIKEMADSHLLNAIHMMERQRIRQLDEITHKYQHTDFADPHNHQKMLEYYSEFPVIYHAMILEAGNRGVVSRKDSAMESKMEAMSVALRNYKESYERTQQSFDELWKEHEELKDRPPMLVIDSLTSLGEKVIQDILRKGFNKKAKTNARKRPHSQGKKKATRKTR